MGKYHLLLYLVEEKLTLMILYTVGFMFISKVHFINICLKVLKHRTHMCGYGEANKGLEL